MSAYADTSFLMAVYLRDAHSESAASVLATAPEALPLTPFGLLELTNAIELRRFRREITPDAASGAWRDIQGDLRAGRLVEAPMPASAYEEARRLAARHTAHLGARTLYILHVGCALARGATRFYTFDRTQARLAKAQGLSVPIRLA